MPNSCGAPGTWLVLGTIGDKSGPWWNLMCWSRFEQMFWNYVWVWIGIRPAFEARFVSGHKKTVGYRPSSVTTFGLRQIWTKIYGLSHTLTLERYCISALCNITNSWFQELSVSTHVFWKQRSERRMGFSQIWGLHSQSRDTRQFRMIWDL